MHRLFVSSAAAVFAALTALAVAPSAHADPATAAAAANARNIITARTARHDVRVALSTQKPNGIPALTRGTKIDFYTKAGSSQVTFVTHGAPDLDRAGAKVGGPSTFINYPVVGTIVLDKTGSQRGAARVSNVQWRYGFDTKGWKKVDFSKK